MLFASEKGLYEIALQYIDFDRQTKLSNGKRSLPFTLQYEQCGTNISVRMKAFMSGARISKTSCQHCITINESKSESAKPIPCVRSDTTGFNQCAMCIMMRKTVKVCKLAHEDEIEVEQQQSHSPARGWDDDDDEQLQQPKTKGNPIDIPKAGAYDFGKNDANLLKRNFSSLSNGTALPSTKQVRRNPIDAFTGNAPEDPMMEMDDTANDSFDHETPTIQTSSYRDERKKKISNIVTLDERTSSPNPGSSIATTSFNPISPVRTAENVMEKFAKQGFGENPYIRLRQEERKVTELKDQITEIKAQHRAELAKLKEEINQLKRRSESDQKLHKLQNQRAHKAEKAAQELRAELKQIQEGER